MYKPKILFTFQYGEENMRKIADLGYDITYIPEEELSMDVVKIPYEIMVCYNPFQKMDISLMKSLKWIQLVSKGINHLPENLIKKSSIIVTNNARATSIPIAELVISYLLQIYKRAPLFYSQKEEKKWAVNHDILEVFGKTIGFLGTGNIASEAAKRLKVFDAVILGMNHSGHPAGDFFDEVYALKELKAFLSKCDVLVSTLPDTPDTYHLLNAETLSFMKKGSSIINVSRGSIIDETALIKKLREGYFRGAALDVFENEPLRTESPLWSFDNVIITPHNALYSDLYRLRVFDMIYDNLKRYLQKDELLNPVNFEKGY